MDYGFTDLPNIIQWHAGAAIFAMAIGPFTLWRRRRDKFHRMLGGLWIILMIVVATTAWFIHTIQLIGPFSPIHLFSLWTYWSLFVALRHVKAGRYKAHGAEMQGLYLWALGVTGIMTLMPGRAMHRILFGSDSWAGLTAMAVLGVGLILVWRYKPTLRVVR